MTASGLSGPVAGVPEPPPIPRDLSTDEPDLPTTSLDDMAPPRPPLEGAPRPTTSLDDMVDAVEEGRLP